MSGGRFLIDRNIFDSSLWSDAIKFRLFIYLVGKATFKDTDVGGIRLNRGQYLRSYRNLAKDLQFKDGRAFKEYSVCTIKRKIDELVKENRIEVKDTDYGTLFTIKNYDKYQCFEDFINQSENDKRTIKERQENDKRTIGEQKELMLINAKNDNTIKAAAIVGEDVPTTSPQKLSEDVPTTSSAADADIEKAINLMSKLYSKYTGRLANSVDYVAMQEIAEITTDEELITNTIALIDSKYKPKFSGDKIKSFKYFTFGLKEAVEKAKVVGNNDNINEHQEDYTIKPIELW